jgi:hypothetical protein
MVLGVLHAFMVPGMDGAALGSRVGLNGSLAFLETTTGPRSGAPPVLNPKQIRGAKPHQSSVALMCSARRSSSASRPPAGLRPRALHWMRRSLRSSGFRTSWMSANEDIAAGYLKTAWSYTRVFWIIAADILEEEALVAHHFRRAEVLAQLPPTQRGWLPKISRLRALKLLSSSEKNLQQRCNCRRVATREPAGRVIFQI